MRGGGGGLISTSLGLFIAGHLDMERSAGNDQFSARVKAAEKLLYYGNNTFFDSGVNNA